MANEQLTVLIPEIATTHPVYANITHVSYTPFDFRLTFSLLTTPHGARREELLAPPTPPIGVAEVVLPAAIVGSFAELLQAELARFVENFGTPQPDTRQSRP